MNDSLYHDQETQPFIKKRNNDSLSLGSLSISSEELELHDVVERTKGKNNSLSKTSVNAKNITNVYKPHEMYGSFEDEKRDYHEKNQFFLQQIAQHDAELYRNSTSSPSSRRDNPRAIELSHPPTTGRSHRRLESIDNDNWEEHSSGTISYNDSQGKASTNNDENDSTHFQPPQRKKVGITTNYHFNDYATRKKLRNEQKSDHNRRHSNELQLRVPPPINESIYKSNNFNEFYMSPDQYSEKQRHKKQKSRDKRFRSRATNDTFDLDTSTEDIHDLCEPFHNPSRKYPEEKISKKMQKKLLKQWFQEAKEEFRIEEEALRAEEIYNRWYNQFFRHVREQIGTVIDSTIQKLSLLETAISNLPLTVGALSLAIVTLGTVWFKFAEENLDSCKPVHFRNPRCTYHEYPGCFECDTTATWYKVAFSFHTTCTFISFVLAFAFFLKVIFATRLVVDEMTHPTMFAPAGLMCATLVSVFTGRFGWVGEAIVVMAASLHLFAVFMFFFMALTYRTLPDPSWFPNTVAVGYAGVKLWTYFPTAGILYMILSMILLFTLFPMSVFRVFFNLKIGAPVAWMQATAPSVALYAFTLVAQPMHSDDVPVPPIIYRYYVPAMHFLFVLCLIGVCSSIHSLMVRWSDFRKKEFSPAHAAFCYTPLCHANAIQAYRGALDSYSTIPEGSAMKIAIYSYWLFVLIAGSCLILVFTLKYFYHLPGWVLVDISDEEEPPSPTETMIRDFITTGERFRQDYINPAVLQANETGALVMISQQDGRLAYRRTRRVTALGFEPIMNMIELETETQILLDAVERNSPRTRSRTLSVPAADFHYGSRGSRFRTQVDEVDHGPSGPNEQPSNDHKRSKTLSWV